MKFIRKSINPRRKELICNGEIYRICKTEG